MAVLGYKQKKEKRKNARRKGGRTEIKIKSISQNA